MLQRTICVIVVGCCNRAGLVPKRLAHICTAMSTPPPDQTVLPEAPPGPSIPAPMPKEIGGPSGPEPTRYGDWEHKGRCSDF
jgi:hypothetical protein